MSGTLRAWFVSEVADAGGASVPHIIFDEAEAFALGGVPVLLILDDGSQVVVGREEREAVADLVKALDACKAGIESAFEWAWLHGQRYDGPTYDRELERVRAILGTNGGENHDKD